MDKKYEFTDETIEMDGSILHRIRATTNFGYIRSGELGGFIEYRSNLSHSDTAWVYDNSRVWGDAWIHSDAKITGNAQVFGHAQVGGSSRISGNAKVFGHALVFENAQVSGSAWICDNSMVFRDCNVSSGIWSKTAKTDHGRYRWYLISTTLKRVYMGSL